MNRKRNKDKFRRAVGLLLAVAGGILVIQMTPLYVWYIMFAGLAVLLVLVLLSGY